ncbi:MAG: group 1 truncated hemoglobin [Marinobacter sp.]|jgi:hemoglobin|uniref:group I truncated hemoglobin n=1 Tax=Marinobacter TaxID=2742 RepID=UPI000C0C83EF|nr:MULTISPECIES: group 1 truncated hemoglobin [Marinobacter]MAM51345.1 group 1 truncated hemoglobin [Marinobacter sp.]MCR9189630.1 group 1 truncated hemoglobin [Alteromonadaceae bacterium]PTB82095.1 group 1 truncated hemoglobin [Marinobacter sp. Z-D5-3]MBW3227626.1 group 1 truncated hemoglobin [Marinobacter adhaerens]MCK5863843.1 group 1 truncated hemoglobin [Marinobacter adhaerens]|tara:strand:- start:57 stop:506 length:450 start_codon:yes stop_codon:yes gene_type:complete
MGLTNRYATLSALLMMLALLLGGCQSLNTEPENSLYQQLGEREGIANVVEDLLYLIVEDERINQQFKGMDVAQFHRNLTDQLCELSGGPCAYTGREMRELHSDMAITDTQFNALAENLILAMEKNDIPTGAQNRLIKQLVPLYPDIRNL